MVADVAEASQSRQRGGRDYVGGVGSRPNAEHFRKHSPELGLLLWAVWDPIGAGVPVDEYESYVPIIWNLLAEHATVDEVAERLDRIAEEQMSLPPGRGRVAAERLSRWWYWRFDFPAEKGQPS